MLHELIPSQGLQGKSQRVGRGNGSKGNTCGKGTKGQKARAGGGVAPWFEGGQTPLFMRLPKLRGFKRYFKLLKDVTPVNIEAIEGCESIKSGDVLTQELLITTGLVKSSSSTPKILGRGSLSKKVTLGEDVLYSQSAKEAIEAAGGSVNS